MVQIRRIDGTIFGYYATREDAIADVTDYLSAAHDDIRVCGSKVIADGDVVFTIH